MGTRLLIATTIALGLSAIGAQASTQTGSMGVSATVSAACTAVAAPLAFGNYSGAQLDQASSVTVTCTNGTPYAVALGDGTGAGASTAQRQLTGPGSQTLNYSIYNDSGHTAVWGANSGNNTVSAVGNGTPQSIQAFGRVPGAQGPTPGVYQDTVVVTLTY